MVLDFELNRITSYVCDSSCIPKRYQHVKASYFKFLEFLISFFVSIPFIVAINADIAE